MLMWLHWQAVYLILPFSLQYKADIGAIDRPPSAMATHQYHRGGTDGLTEGAPSQFKTSYMLKSALTGASDGVKWPGSEFRSRPLRQVVICMVQVTPGVDGVGSGAVLLCTWLYIIPRLIEPVLFSIISQSRPSLHSFAKLWTPGICIPQITTTP